ncbi:hypothetical protein EON67_03880 [archaeon]|nr:MAG: hypothetical protein EON67_03880 [archaeon]
MRVLGDPSASAAAVPVLLNSCQDTFRALIAERRVRAAQAAKDGVTSVSASASGSGLRTVATSSASADASEQLKIVSHVDDCLNLRLLRANRGAGDDAALDDGDDVSLRSSSEVKENFTERLKRIHQLTGFADSVYAEVRRCLMRAWTRVRTRTFARTRINLRTRAHAHTPPPPPRFMQAYVQVHEFDILLEILLINRTDATLTNVVLELSTMGDLRLVDRPASFTLAPKASKTIKANIKVSARA